MKLSYFLMKATAMLALVLTVANVNAACGCVMHQPKVPASALKYKK